MSTKIRGFAKKIADKGVWEARRRVYGKPPVEVLYHWQNDGSGVGPEDSEFVHRVPGPIYIDPLYGYAFTHDGVLLEASMSLNWRHGLPSPDDLLKRIKVASDLIELDEAVSLRRFWEWNYFHFHVDVLGKLELLHRVGVPRDTPLVVGRYVRELSYPAEILNEGSLAARRIIAPNLENREIIRAKSLYYCQTLRSYRTRMDYVMDEMAVPVPSADPQTKDGRRVFLIRRPPATRALSNTKEIEAITTRYGFETIDTVGMSMHAQIALFNTTRFLIAIHGAGMTNTIYRRGAPLSVLELHSDSYAEPCFLNISADYGYAHQRLVGPALGGNPKHAPFSLDPPQFEQAVRALLAPGT